LLFDFFVELLGKPLCFERAGMTMLHYANAEHKTKKMDHAASNHLLVLFFWRAT
jgi:hypothetical protein